MTYYFAYGSNLNKAQMAVRCPNATPVGKIVVQNTRLVFRGVADIETKKGASVQGAIWKITRKCEAALDRYEGVRSGLYRKEYIKIRVVDKNGGVHDGDALVYIMTSTNTAPPSDFYLDVIRRGYADFGLDVAQLNAIALAHGYVDPGQVDDDDDEWDDFDADETDGEEESDD